MERLALAQVVRQIIAIGGDIGIDLVKISVHQKLLSDWGPTYRDGKPWCRRTERRTDRQRTDRCTARYARPDGRA